MLNNVEITYGYRGSTLAGTSRPLGLIRILADQRSCTNLLDKAGSLLNLLTPCPIGPCQTLRYYAFDANKISEISVTRIRSILAEFSVPALPYSWKGVSSSPPQSMWVRDSKMGRHVLPVCSNLYKITLSFLAIGFNTYPVLSQCAIMGARLWKRPLIFFVAVVFLCLWLHRNDIRFRDFQANIMDVQARVKAAVVLYIECYFQKLLVKSLRTSTAQSARAIGKPPPF
ncbi:hypothetical protein Plhal703r1_c60g0165291 [Plasmopara halstedii]